MSISVNINTDDVIALEFIAEYKEARAAELREYITPAASRC